MPRLVPVASATGSWWRRCEVDATSAISQAKTSAKATISKTVRLNQPSTSYPTIATTSAANARYEKQAKPRGMRCAYQRVPRHSDANAAAASRANALCSTGTRSIGTAPTPIRPKPTRPMCTRIDVRAPRRIPKGPITSARVSAPESPAMPAPDTMTATLKQTAARSFEVPSVEKLRVHQSPVGVMLMLARLPAASSIATRLKVRYASWSIE
ncbi:MAG TPA: hypothetical protein VGE78_10210 [Agromyces sp.]